jgi:hypothetical protein
MTTPCWIVVLLSGVPPSHVVSSHVSVCNETVDQGTNRPTSLAAVEDGGLSLLPDSAAGAGLVEVGDDSVRAGRDLHLRGGHVQVALSLNGSLHQTWTSRTNLRAFADVVNPGTAHLNVEDRDARAGWECELREIRCDSDKQPEKMVRSHV